MPVFLRNLITARNSAKVSVSEAEKALGFTPGNLESFESGEAEPSLGQLWELADYYNTSADFLMGRVFDITDTTAPKLTRISVDGRAEISHWLEERLDMHLRSGSATLTTAVTKILESLRDSGELDCVLAKATDPKKQFSLRIPRMLESKYYKLDSLVLTNLIKSSFDTAMDTVNVTALVLLYKHYIGRPGNQLSKANMLDDLRKLEYWKGVK